MKYTDPGVRPEPTKPDLSDVPDELRGVRQWCLWKYVFRNGSWTKVPYSSSGKPASSTDPDTWDTFDRCSKLYKSGTYDGLGFVFSDDSPYVGIDLDHCVDEGRVLSSFASDLVKRFDTYTEFSPSASGVHLIGKSGALKAAKGKVDGNDVEVYRTGRYFTFTGDRIGKSDVSVIDTRVRRLTDQIRSTQTASIKEPRTVAAKATGSTDERLKEALKDVRIKKIFDGDLSDYGDDQSRADLALASKLVPYSGGDRDVLDAMFRGSALFRDKWDDRHGADTYGNITLAKALESYVVESPEVLRKANRHTIDSLWDSVMAFRENGDARGVDPGWVELEKLYRPAEGLMTVLGGTPSSGKSTFMDVLAYNLAKLHDWKTTFISFESLPLQRHILNMCQIHLQKPTFTFVAGHATEKEMDRARAEIGEWFSFVMPDEDAFDVDSLLQYVDDDIEELGVKGFVIDPFTEIDLRRTNGESEVEAIKNNLAKIQKFTRSRMLHSWILAHPTKSGETYVEANDKSLRPTMYSLAGAAHFNNKADFGLIIHRQTDNRVGLYVDKVRNDSTGQRGSVMFKYHGERREYEEEHKDKW